MTPEIDDVRMDHETYAKLYKEHYFILETMPVNKILQTDLRFKNIFEEYEAGLTEKLLGIKMPL